MAKKMITDTDINTYRSAALLLTACPYLGNGVKPVYWNGKFKGINAYGLGEVLNVKPKDIAAYFKGNLPGDFLLDAEQYFRDNFKKEGWTIGDFTEEEVLEEVSGEKLFMGVAVPYVRDVVMKSKKRDIEMCIPTEARDKYSIQVAEATLSGNRQYTGNNYKVVSFNMTDSMRFAEIHFAEIPMKDVDGKKVPCEATGFVQFGMSDKHPLSSDKEEFMANVIDVINGNVSTYKDSLCPQVISKFRKDVIYGAGVLGKKL